MSDPEWKIAMQLWLQYREQYGIATNSNELSPAEQLALVQKCRTTLALFVGPQHNGLSGTLALVMSHWSDSWTRELINSQIWKEVASILESVRSAITAGDLLAAESKLLRLIRLGCRSSRYYFPVDRLRASTSELEQHSEPLAKGQSSSGGLDELTSWFSRLRT